MGKMIIKKEDLKEDVEIEFENNTVYGFDYKKAFINLVDGKLSINISNQTIVSNDILEKIELKKEYCDKFLLK